jgi:proline iminopeptidase
MPLCGSRRCSTCSIIPRIQRSPSSNSILTCFTQIGGDDADFIVGGDLGLFDVRRALSKLKMPMLVLTGRFDRAVPPRLAMDYKHSLPHAQFVIFDESGYAPFVEETPTFVEVVKTFLHK